MITYARLSSESTLEYYQAPRNISNPRARIIEEDAYASGFFPLHYSPAAHDYCDSSWIQESETIKQIWTDWPLERARLAKKEELEMHKNAQLEKKCDINIINLGISIVYDRESLFNIMGLLELETSSYFIDSKDKVHELSYTQIKDIFRALRHHRRGIYDRKLALFDQCELTQNMESIIKIKWTYPESSSLSEERKISTAPRKAEALKEVLES